MPDIPYQLHIGFRFIHLPNSNMFSARRQEVRSEGGLWRPLQLGRWIIMVKLGYLDQVLGGLGLLGLLVGDGG